MNWKLIFVYSLLLLQLSGCSIIAIGYNYSDVYLRYSINSYANFNDEQKIIITKEVDDFMLWHRENMLPEYVRFLQELQVTVQSGAVLTKEDAARFRARVRTLYVNTLQPTVLPTAKVLSGIYPLQIEELVESFDKENNKQREKGRGGNSLEQRRKRAEKTIDFLENMVGVLSDRQLDKIREMSNNLPYTTVIYLQQREDNQARLLELLRNGKNEEEIAMFLSSWLLTPELSRSPEEQLVILASENAYDEMVATVYQLLTVRQRKALLGNIVKYIDIFQNLSSKS